MGVRRQSPARSFSRPLCRQRLGWWGARGAAAAVRAEPMAFSCVARGV